ncbi:MAG: hypothetical protein ACK4GO_15875 [Gemmobacter sp.]
MRRRVAAVIALVLALSPLPVVAQQGPDIGYKENIALKVGQSVVIYGFRGDCGKLPNRREISVPATKTSKIAFGRDGWRLSKRCGGKTPAVELVFTATAVGREAIKIQGDDIRIRVSQ